MIDELSPWDLAVVFCFGIAAFLFFISFLDPKLGGGRLVPAGLAFIAAGLAIQAVVLLGESG